MFKINMDHILEYFAKHIESVERGRAKYSDTCSSISCAKFDYTAFYNNIGFRFTYDQSTGIINVRSVNRAGILIEYDVFKNEYINDVFKLPERFTFIYDMFKDYMKDLQFIVKLFTNISNEGFAVEHDSLWVFNITSPDNHKYTLTNSYYWNLYDNDNDDSLVLQFSDDNIEQLYGSTNIVSSPSLDQIVLCIIRTYIQSNDANRNRVVFNQLTYNIMDTIDLLKHTNAKNVPAYYFDHGHFIFTNVHNTRRRVMSYYKDRDVIEMKANRKQKIFTITNDEYNKETFNIENILTLEEKLFIKSILNDTILFD